MTPAPQEFAGRYATEAVESRVFDSEREVIGHVGLLDVDSVPLRAAEDVAGRLPGPVAVLETSRESYHLWSLAVDSLDAWIERTGSMDAVDPEHVALSASRGCGVVRIDAKVRLTTGEEEKPKPTLLRVVDGEGDRQLSEPHGRLLREEFDADVDVEDGREWVGYSTERRTYMADIGGRD